MQKVILNIGGMSCSACSNGLEKYLNKQSGIISASVNLVLGQALIEYEDNLTLDDLSKFISDAGYENLGMYDEVKQNKKKNNIKLLVVFGILSVFILYISMSHMLYLPTIPFLNMEKYPINYSICLFILSIPYLIYGFDILKNGYKNLIHKMPNMDTLVSIGVISSFIYSLFGTIMIFCCRVEYVENLYFESACIVIYFIKLGRFIDSRSKEKTKEAISDLVQITPKKAILKLENGYKEVTIDEIKKGDILICKPGMKIAVDGIITSGFSHIDESFITGESTPIKKTVLKSVVAGSLNLDGYIEYKAERIGRDSTISSIVKLVVLATNTKAPVAKIADKVSGIFVPCIMVIAFLTLIVYILLGFDINIALTHFVTVLVVACPCSLGLATPLSIVVSEGICAKNGILVKTSETLENAHKVDTIVFDKTGTLTYGNLKISKIFNYSDYTEEELLTVLASIESKSFHPIANAFSSYAKINKLKLIAINDFKNLPGIGLQATIDKNEYYIGNNKILKNLNVDNIYLKDEETLSKNGSSIVYMIKNNQVIALIGVKDIVRDNASSVISELKKLNKDVIMLTGDNSVTANVIARELGINKVIANVLPKDKVDKIKELMNNSKKVMMVGDGINDAPSLVTANIGVSVSSGTDIASNSADVILMNDNLYNLLNLIKISDKTIKNIKLNLFWAFFYNICMIPIAVGLFSKFNINMNPMVAGFAMTLSSLTVIFNALRLKKVKLRRD